jgi:hypothetical protein
MAASLKQGVGYRGARTIGHMGGDDPDWMPPTSSKARMRKNRRTKARRQWAALSERHGSHRHDVVMV